MTSTYDSEELIRRAVAAVKRYRDREDWWDIRQEAVLGALLSVKRAQKAGKENWTVACFYGARWAVSDYLRPPKERRSKTPAPEIRSLDELLEGDWEPVSEDPAEEIIGRVALWEEVERCADARELEFARRVWLNDESQDEVAKDMGVSRPLVSKCLCNLRRKLRGEG